MGQANITTEIITFVKYVQFGKKDYTGLFWEGNSCHTEIWKLARMVRVLPQRQLCKFVPHNNMLSEQHCWSEWVHGIDNNLVAVDE